MSSVKILALAGSTRRDSFNGQLLQAGAEMARSHAAEVTLVDLREFEMPLFDQDLESEQGLPENAKRLKEIFVGHQGLLLACPEYNSSITPLLKNVIDWTSRPAGEDDPPLSAYRGKTAAIISASPGGFGGLRGLRHVREILSNIGVLVVPKQFALSAAHQAFDDSGKLADERHASQLEACISQLVETVSALQKS